MIPRETARRYVSGRVVAVVVVAVSAVALGVVFTTTATFDTAVASDDVTLGCVADTDEGAAYVTDSGLTVYENAGGVTYGTFLGNRTVEFQGGDITLSANSNGTAETRLDVATGVPCLANLSATGTDVGVDPNNTSSITVGQGGEFGALTFRDVVYVPDDAATDLAYEANSFGALVLHRTGLEDGTEVEAVDASSGTTLETATVGGGSVEFESLPEGEVKVNFGVAGDNGVAGDRPAQDCVERRDISRGQADNECPRDRDLGRGETRDKNDQRRNRGR